jgi:hypothetical protein
MYTRPSGPGRHRIQSVLRVRHRNLIEDDASVRQGPVAANVEPEEAPIGLAQDSPLTCLGRGRVHVLALARRGWLAWEPPEVGDDQRVADDCQAARRCEPGRLDADVGCLGRSAKNEAADAPVLERNVALGCGLHRDIHGLRRKLVLLDHGHSAARDRLRGFVRRDGVIVELHDPHPGQRCRENERNREGRVPLAPRSSEDARRSDQRGDSRDQEVGDRNAHEHDQSGDDEGRALVDDSSEEGPGLGRERQRERRDATEADRER